MFFSATFIASALLIAAPFVASLPTETETSLAARYISEIHDLANRGLGPDTCELVVSFEWDVPDEKTKIATISQKNIFVIHPTDSTVNFLTVKPQTPILAPGATVVALKNGYKSVSVTTEYTDNVPQDEATLSVADFTIVGDSTTYNTLEFDEDNVSCHTIVSDLPLKKIIIGTCEFSCSKLKKSRN